MAGLRFLIAGALLFAWGYVREGGRPTRQHWRSAAVVGALLLVGGNGAVAWSEQYVPSGWASLVIAITPLWMVLLEWLRTGGAGPTRRTMLGLATGFAGLAVLVGPSRLLGGRTTHPLGAAALLVGTISWASGSIVSRSLPLPHSPRLSTGMQMLAGGALLIALGAVTGEFADARPASVSARSLVALGYLIVFGAIIGFTAYTWLLKVSTPARVSTYAYVNPVVALALGWLVGREPLEGRTVVAAVIILGAVAVITTARPARSAVAS